MQELLKLKGQTPELVERFGQIWIEDHAPQPRKSILHKKQSAKNIIERLQTEGQFLRSIVQSFFFGLILWIGIDFYRFVRYFETSGQTTWVNRPPGVEGFLPISALISLKYWVQSGIINTIHPSGLFILLAVMTVSWF